MGGGELAQPTSIYKGGPRPQVYSRMGGPRPQVYSRMGGPRPQVYSRMGGPRPQVYSSDKYITEYPIDIKYKYL